MMLVILYVILLSMLMIVISDLIVIKQQLVLAFELECYPRDTVAWNRKWLIDFSAGKTQLVLVDRSSNCCAIDAEMNGSNLDENLSF